ncbi:hypothetical protein BJY04DRAFT_227936 [Aspergillus karnatakaensis]|uniref:FAD-dependent oxidoreductase n=1 Tax=Aspergillus karnatakaensis TaxID=1810916 RepID=UPI003CCCF910
MNPTQSPIQSSFKVLVIGGSIAGLTLAHCLDRLNVDYTVLEKREEIAPQEGASIGILPHGGRILDQLGLFNEVARDAEPLVRSHVAFPDGFVFTDKLPGVVSERFGLPLIFLERQRLLEILYQSLPDSSRILVGKSVVSVDQERGGNGVSVQTQDGSTYNGNLVVGADGVHSLVRREMWRHAEAESPGLITAEEKDGLKVNYITIFGISTSISALQPGEQTASLHPGRSYLAFPDKGKESRVFWFLQVKLDREYAYSSTPRWSSADMEKTAERFADDHIWAGVRFGDLWKRRVGAGITNLEEHVFETWVLGRIVCIGDSMHKLAPNTGQGGNSAIEDAAALANALKKALDTTSSNFSISPPNTILQPLLRSFNETRLSRMQSISKSARLVLRLHARETLLLRLLGRYILPYSGNLTADLYSKVVASGEELTFLAPSAQARVGAGWEEFHGKKGGLSRYLGLTIVVGVVVLGYGILGTGRSSLI